MRAWGLNKKNYRDFRAETRRQKYDDAQSSLKTIKCVVCEAVKKEGQPFCLNCYRKLKPETKKSLYGKGFNFVNAFWNAMRELGHRELPSKLRNY